MRKIITGILLLLAAQQSLAQNSAGESSTLRASSPTQFGASHVQGLHFELVKPIVEIELSAGGGSLEDDMENVIGLGIGYKSVTVGQVGFLGGATFITGEVEDTSEDLNFLKLDANATVGLNNAVYLLGGLNISKLMSGPGNSEDVVDEIGFGFQAGVGIQFNQNIEGSFKIVSMKQEGDSEGVSIDLEEKGFEFGLGSTF